MQKKKYEMINNVFFFLNKPLELIALLYFEYLCIFSCLNSSDILPGIKSIMPSLYHT